MRKSDELMLSDIPSELIPLANTIFDAIERGSESVGEFKWGTQFAKDEYYRAAATLLYLFLHLSDQKVGQRMLATVLQLTEQSPLSRLVAGAGDNPDNERIQRRFAHACALLGIEGPTF